MLKEIVVEITVKESDWNGDVLSHVEFKRSTPADLVDQAIDFTTELNEAVHTAETRALEEIAAQRRLIETQRETTKLSAVPDEPA